MNALRISLSLVHRLLSVLQQMTTPENNRFVGRLSRLLRALDALRECRIHCSMVVTSFSVASCLILPFTLRRLPSVVYLPSHRPSFWAAEIALAVPPSPRHERTSCMLSGSGEW